MSMRRPGRGRHDLGACSAIGAEAIGRPGERTFRIRAKAEGGSVILWLEKEQLHELAMAIKQLLRREVRGGEPRAPVPGATSADFEFKAARLALGRDPDSPRYVLAASVREDEDAGVTLWLDAGQLDALADQALDVHAGGRPRCPLCGAPMTAEHGEPHMCVRTNGHARLPDR